MRNWDLYRESSLIPKTQIHITPGIQETATNRFDDIVIRDNGLSKKSLVAN